MDKRDPIADNYMETMNKYLDKVSSLKKTKPLTSAIVKAMRVLHGKAIIEMTRYKGALEHKQSGTEEEYYALSYSMCVLHIIHNKIMKSEKKVHKHMATDGQRHGPISSEEQGANPFSSEGQFPAAIIEKKAKNQIQNQPKNPLERMVSIKDAFHLTPNRPTFVSDGNGGKLINLESTDQQHKMTGGIQSDSFGPLEFSIGGKGAGRAKDLEGSFDLSSLFSIQPKIGSKKVVMEGTITTTSSEQKLDVTKPTLVNYWGEWCHFSREFKPHWAKFKELVSQKYPHIQVVDIDVARDASLTAQAKFAGGTALPMVVFYQAGKRQHLAGLREADEVMRWLESTMKA